MALNFSWWRSLKIRVTIFTLAIFLISIWSLSLFASWTLREDLERLSGEQQFSTVSIMAAVINEELASRVNGLENVAGMVSPVMLDNMAALQEFLDNRPVLQNMFSGGLIAVGRDGTAIAEVPLSAGRIGINYADFEHVAVALNEGKSKIGQPVIGRKLHRPLFSIAAPIRDAQGRVIGALLGVVDLEKPSFLDKITDNRYGATGGFLLISPQRRLIVTATDKSRIMQPLPAPGVNPQIDRFVQGAEGTVVYVNAVGVEILNSVKSIPVAGWYLAANLPTVEAFAPMRPMQQRILMATILLTVLVGFLTWWMLRRQLAPMSVAAKSLAILSASAQPPQPLPVARQDEIGELIGGFNSLLETVAQREAALKKNEQALRLAEEQMSISQQISCTGSWVYHLETNEIWGSAEGLRLFGFPPVAGNFPIDDIEACIPDRERVHQALVDLISNGRAYDLEFTINPANLSSPKVVRSIARLEMDARGNPLRVLGFIQDITERKQMEDQVRHLAFHDPLTKLPNRRLLIERLNMAVAASKRSGHYVALMFLDLDNFKPINDKHGHVAGDLLLIEAAERLKRCVREVDTVARFGGDEFVVIVELDADKSGSAARAGIIAEKFRDELAKPYVFNIQHAGEAETIVEHHCTASIGVALFHKDETSQDNILKWADVAMYQAKGAGGNLVRFYDPKA